MRVFGPILLVALSSLFATEKRVQYNAGMSFNYGHLQLDILVNNNFWITGPQMIFNDLYGTLGLCADLVYTF